MENRQIDWKKYLLVLLITSLVFATAVYTNNYFNNKRIDEMRSTQEEIYTNITSSEVEVALLSDIACDEAGSSMLYKELNPLAEKISYSEENIGDTNADVVALKKAYSLLEIKDYLLMKNISNRCGKKIGFALYFYGNEESCSECQKASYVLTYLRNKYPELRVYSFDYNLDLSAIKTLISMFKIKDDLPAIVIGREVINGFQEKEELEKILLTHYPKLKDTATTTKEIK